MAIYSNTVVLEHYFIIREYFDYGVNLESSNQSCTRLWSFWCRSFVQLSSTPPPPHSIVRCVVAVTSSPRTLLTSPPRAWCLGLVSQPRSSRGHRCWWHYGVCCSKPSSYGFQSPRRKTHCVPIEPRSSLDLAALQTCSSMAADISREQVCTSVCWQLLGDRRELYPWNAGSHGAVPVCTPWLFLGSSVVIDRTDCGCCSLARSED